MRNNLPSSVPLYTIIALIFGLSFWPWNRSIARLTLDRVESPTKGRTDFNLFCYFKDTQDLNLPSEIQL